MCGMMSAADAVAAAQAGADAVGMVFYRAARRCIMIDVAREIIQSLPPFVTPVGLFVNAEVEEIRETAGMLGLRHLQLHGEESPEFVAQLKERVVLKAIRVASNIREELAQWRAAIASHGLTHLRGILLETGGVSMGGSGVENDWELIGRLQADGSFDGLPAVIMAGGLAPENVAGVVRRLKPWAVDVSSGVEAVFGKKSPEKMAGFVKAVRAGEA
jgi:phosphoribosylanthranilate isomerase